MRPLWETFFSPSIPLQPGLYVIYSTDPACSYPSSSFLPSFLTRLFKSTSNHKVVHLYAQASHNHLYECSRRCGWDIRIMQAQKRLKLLSQLSLFETVSSTLNEDDILVLDVCLIKSIGLEDTIQDFLIDIATTNHSFKGATIITIIGGDKSTMALIKALLHSKHCKLGLEINYPKSGWMSSEVHGSLQVSVNQLDLNARIKSKANITGMFRILPTVSSANGHGLVLI